MEIGIYHQALKSIQAPATCIRVLFLHFGATPKIRARLCTGTDFDEQRVQNESTELTLFSYVTFGENLTQIAGEDWALDLIEPFGTRVHGALEIAVCSAANAGDSLHILQQFGSTHFPFFSLGLKRSSQTTALTFKPLVEVSQPTQRALAELVLLSTAAMLKPVLSAAVADLEFHFPWPEPRYGNRMRSLFKQSVCFERPDCALVLPRKFDLIRSPYSDPVLLAAAQKKLAATAQRIRGADILILRLCQLLRCDGTRRRSIDEAARELGMSRRTLVRRLAERGTTYRALRDATLRQCAAAMLEDGALAADEIAEALGFADLTGFTRACRRWFPRERVVRNSPAWKASKSGRPVHGDRIRRDPGEPPERRSQ